MDNQQPRHQLERVGDRWHCQVCQWSWSTRRRSACPGVPRYAYEAWPPTLHPAGELKRLGKAVPPSPGGCAYQLWEPHWLWLYDNQEAAPLPKTFGTRLLAIIFGEKTGCQICGYDRALMQDQFQLWNDISTR